MHVTSHNRVLTRWQIQLRLPVSCVKLLHLGLEGTYVISPLHSGVTCFVHELFEYSHYLWAATCHVFSCEFFNCKKRKLSGKKYAQRNLQWVNLMTKKQEEEEGEEEDYVVDEWIPRTCWQTVLTIPLPSNKALSSKETPNINNSVALLQGTRKEKEILLRYLLSLCCRRSEFLLLRAVGRRRWHSGEWKQAST